MGKSRVGVLASEKGGGTCQLGCTNLGFHQDVIIPYKDRNTWFLQQTAPLRKLPSSRACDHPLQILLENSGGTGSARQGWGGWLCQRSEI